MKPVAATFAVGVPGPDGEPEDPRGVVGPPEQAPTLGLLGSPAGDGLVEFPFVENHQNFVLEGEDLLLMLHGDLLQPG